MPPCWSTNTVKRTAEWGYEQDGNSGRRRGTRDDLGKRRRHGARISGGAHASQIDAKAVVADVQRILDANYVLPEMRPKLSAALSQGLAAGRYNVSDPSVLAERINADMSAVAHDKHLGMQYDPAQAGAAGRKSAPVQVPTTLRRARRRFARPRASITASPR